MSTLTDPSTNGPPLKPTPLTDEQRGVEAICVRLPTSLMREVRILLLDPTYGKIKYGQLRYLITALLTQWLEDKKKKLETVDGEVPPPDRFEVFDKEGL